MSHKAINYAFEQIEKRDKELGSFDRNVLMVLARCHNGKTEQCNPRISTIVRNSGCSMSTVYRCLNNLTALEMIKRNKYSSRNVGTCNEYEINIDGNLYKPKSYPQSVQKMESRCHADTGVGVTLTPTHYNTERGKRERGKETTTEEYLEDMFVVNDEIYEEEEERIAVNSPSNAITSNMDTVTERSGVTSKNVPNENYRRSNVLILPLRTNRGGLKNERPGLPNNPEIGYIINNYFKQLWDIYPEKKSEQESKKMFEQKLMPLIKKDPTVFDTILKALRVYIRYVKKHRAINEQYNQDFKLKFKHLKNWIYNEDYKELMESYKTDLDELDNTLKLKHDFKTSAINDVGRSNAVNRTSSVNQRSYYVSDESKRTHQVVEEVVRTLGTRLNHLGADKCRFLYDIVNLYYLPPHLSNDENLKTLIAFSKEKIWDWLIEYSKICFNVRYDKLSDETMKHMKKNTSKIPYLGEKT